MSDPVADAETARAARNSAKGRLSQRFSTLKGEYAEKGIGARIGDQVSGKVKDAAQNAVEVAGESKGIILGSVSLLGLWLARRPLTSMGRKFWIKARDRIDKGF